MKTYIRHISTAVPKHGFSQTEAAEVLKHIYGERFPEIERYFSSFGNTLIKNRYSAVPLEWFFEDHGWRDRNSVYKDAALELLQRTTSGCLKNSGLNASDIDAIITVSTTGVATPSLESYLMDIFPFRENVFRLPVFGWGCAGGVLGLVLGQQLLQSPDINNVLLLSVEFCTMCFSKEALNPKDIISTSLFSDGAAAVLVTKEKTQGLEIGPYLKHRWPDSISVMGWDVQDKGLNVIFSQKIPEIVRDEYPKLVDRFLRTRGRSITDYSYFLAHPGGPRVIEYLEKTYSIPGGAMQETRAVLSQFGNMSSPTVLFVLDEFMKSGKTGKAMVSTLGPGFTAAILEVKTV